MDHRVLAEGTEDAHGAVLAARTGKREMLAGQVAFQDRRAPVADRLAPGGAVAAGAAVRDERADDVVAGLYPCHARSHLLDDPGALVAKHHRQARLEVPVRDVDVGVAQARVQVADQDLTVLRPVQVELLDLDALARLVDDGCLGLHRLSFDWVTPLTLPPRPPHVQACVSVSRPPARLSSRSCRHWPCWARGLKESRSPPRRGPWKRRGSARRGWYSSTLARSPGTGADGRATPTACCRWALPRRRTSGSRTPIAGDQRLPPSPRRWPITPGSGT